MEAAESKEQAPEVVRVGLVSMQVCVPATTTDRDVEDFANSESPTGIQSRWSIRRAGDPSLNGDPERCPCAERAGCVHIVLDC